MTAPPLQVEKPSSKGLSGPRGPRTASARLQDQPLTQAQWGPSPWLQPRAGRQGLRGASLPPSAYFPLFSSRDRQQQSQSRKDHVSAESQGWEGDPGLLQPGRDPDGPPAGGLASWRIPHSPSRKLCSLFLFLILIFHFFTLNFSRAALPPEIMAPPSQLYFQVPIHEVGLTDQGADWMTA